jgi:hypothetical protein
MMIFTSCSKESDEIVINKKFYPLAVGNTWYYDIEENGNQDADEHKISVVKDTIINIDLETYNSYVVESYRISNLDKKWNFYWGHDNEENLIQYGASLGGFSIIDKSIQFKKNPSVGDNWSNSHLILTSGIGFRAELNNIECVQIDTFINTKAGLFGCIKYYDKFKRFEYEDEKRFYYINPKVGLIKFTLISNGEIETEWTLKKYILK